MSCHSRLKNPKGKAVGLRLYHVKDNGEEYYELKTEWALAGNALVLHKGTLEECEAWINGYVEGIKAFL